MSEQELRDGLRAAVADEPALAFDADVLLDKAKREIKRRRALVGAGLATASVAVAAVAVPTMLGTPRGGGRAAGPGWGPGACGEVSGSADPSWPGSASVVPSDYPSVSGSILPTPYPSGVPTPSGSVGSPSPSVNPPELTVPSAPPGSAYKFEVPSPGAPLTSSLVPVEPVPPEVVVSSEPPIPCPSEPSEASASAHPMIDIPWPPANVKVASYTAEQLRKRGLELQNHLQTRFATVVAGATDVFQQAFGGQSLRQFFDGQTSMGAHTGFTLRGVHSAVGVQLFAPGAHDARPPAEVCLDAQCSPIQQPDGSWTVVKNERLDKERVAVSVIHYRNTGAVTKVTAYNYDPLGADPTVHKIVPVNPAELIALATDPALSF